MLSPKLPLTVDLDFWNALANACGGPYADSYLSGAELHDGRLLPRTVTAWERLKDNGQARWVFEQQKVKLLKPPPYRENTMVQLQSRGSA